MFAVGGLRALGHHALLTQQTAHCMEKGRAEDGQGRTCKVQGLTGALCCGSKCAKC